MSYVVSSEKFTGKIAACSSSWPQLRRDDPGHLRTNRPRKTDQPAESHAHMTAYGRSTFGHARHAARVKYVRLWVHNGHCTQTFKVQALNVSIQWARAISGSLATTVGTLMINLLPGQPDIPGPFFKASWSSPLHDTSPNTDRRKHLGVKMLLNWSISPLPLSLADSINLHLTSVQCPRCRCFPQKPSSPLPYHHQRLWSQPHSLNVPKRRRNAQCIYSVGIVLLYCETSRTISYK